MIKSIEPQGGAWGFFVRQHGQTSHSRTLAILAVSINETVIPSVMPIIKKKRRSPISFRCSLHEEALIAEAARRKGISRGCLMRSAALLAANEVLGVQ